MKPQTTQEACKRFCPFTFDGGAGASTCVTNHCMAWRVVHDEVRREDHSGNRERVAQWGQETARIPRREGGPVSDDIVDRLDAAAERLAPLSVSSRPTQWENEALLCEEAADEIKRLRGINTQFAKAIVYGDEHFNADEWETIIGRAEAITN